MNNGKPSPTLSDGEKPHAETAESLDRVPRGHKAKRHCLRFWWAYLLATICIIVLVVCLIIFVAVPKLAQKQLDNAVLTVEGISASQAQSNNFTIAINSTIRTDGKYASSSVRPFIGVMYLEDLSPHTPFLSIDFPATTGASLQTVNISQFVTPDVAAFTTFNAWLLYNQTLRVTVTGDTKVRVKGIARDYSVTFTKTVTLNGLNGIPGLNVVNGSSMIALGSLDSSGDNFNGTVNVPNLSEVTFDLGNASFTTYLLNQSVGMSYLDNAVLRPGNNNNFAMRANINQSAILSALGQQPYCSNGGQLPFVLAGKDVVNYGQNLTYYSGALASGNLSLTLGIGADIKKFLNITIPCGGL